MDQCLVLRIHLGEAAGAIEHAVRREPDAHVVCADGGDRGARHFQRKAVAIGGAAAVAVGAGVDVGVQKLFDQVAVGRVQLHTVKAGFDSQLGGVHKFGHRSVYIGLRHRVGLGVRLHALGVGVDLAL